MPDSPSHQADAANTGSTIARSGSRLKLAWDITTDGIRVPHEAPFAFFDADRNEQCVRQQWSDDLTRCTPSVSNNGALVYADSACTVPVIEGSLSQPPSQPYWLEYAPGQISKIAAFYSLGAEVATYPTTVWDLVNGACTNPIPMGTGPHTFRFYDAVAIPSTAFVELTTTTDAGSDPLEAVKYTSPDGLLWPLDRAYSTADSSECALNDTPYVPTTASCGSLTLSRSYDATSSTRLRPIDLTYAPSFVHYDHFLYDTALGSECAFGGDVGSGTSRCSPFPTAQIKSLYSNPSCATPIDVIEIIPPAIPTVYAYRQTPALEFHHVGAQHLATLYWGGPGACEQFTGYEAPPNAQFFDVDSAIVGSDQFASASIVVDP